MGRLMPGMKFAADVSTTRSQSLEASDKGVNLESNLVPGFAQGPEDEFAIEVVVEMISRRSPRFMTGMPGPTAVVHGRLVEPIR
jgi:hypothetical protein